jgi:hypothetical protein
MGEGGIAVRAAVACPAPEPDPAPVAAAASFPVSPGPARPPAPTCAAEAVIGFPQSMQNRELASFSRPQKVHAVKTVSLPGGRGKSSWGANIGMALGSGQLETAKRIKGAESQRTRSPKLRQVPNGARFQTALSGAKSRTARRAKCDKERFSLSRLAPFGAGLGISRSRGLRAVRKVAPFRTWRPLGLRAVWDSAPFEPPSFGTTRSLLLGALRIPSSNLQVCVLT